MIAKLIGNIGNDLVANEGTRDRGRVLMRDALTRYIALGDRTGQAMIQWSLGKAAIDAGDSMEGRRLLEQSLRISRELQFTHPMASILLWMARFSCSEGYLRRAIRLVGAAQNVVTETGRTLDQAEQDRLQATLAAGAQSLTQVELEDLLGPRTAADTRRSFRHSRFNFNAPSLSAERH